MTQYTRDRQGPDGSGVQSGVTTKLGQPVGKLNELSRQRRCSMILQMQHGRLLARLPTSFLEKMHMGQCFCPALDLDDAGILKLISEQVVYTSVLWCHW